MTNLTKTLCEIEDLVDIAPLGKATQSSLSQWSKPNDAQRAVMDVGGVNYAFHTDKEQNPWWELTLDKPRLVEYIILHNRKDMCKEKSRKLIVEVYNSKEYIKIYEGDLLFDAEPNGLPLILPYKYSQTIERIKITSQINEYFHLSKVNVLVVNREEKLPNGKKIVFCRMRGGLADGLGQVQICYEYAKKYNRRLYIDGQRGSLSDNLSNYFLAPDGVYLGVPKQEEFLSCYPKCLKDDIIDYKTQYDLNLGHVHASSGVSINFDLLKSYYEDVLVREHNTNNPNAFKVFEWLRLNEKVKLHIVDILDKLGEYDAIHVRNTDLKTDYKTFFKNIKDKLVDKAVLCTDDLQCQLYAKSFFGNKLHIVTDIPDIAGKPIHYYPTTDKFATNLATITDLFILASAKNLFFTTILPNIHYSFTLKGTMTSGFSRLAKSLHERQDLVKKILYGE
jgi:hypothetical protein